MSVVNYNNGGSAANALANFARPYGITPSDRLQTEQLPMSVLANMLAGNLDGVINVKSFGAVGDGVTDDTAAFQSAVSAVNAAGRGSIFIPAGTYLLTESIGISTVPTSIIGAGVGVSILRPNTGAATVKFVEARTDDFTVMDLTVDGSLNTSTLTGNQYAFFSGDGNTKYVRHRYVRVQIVDFINSADLTPIYTTPVTSHAIYVDNVDGVTIAQCEMRDTLGAAVFARDVDNLVIDGNLFVNNYWYPVNFEAGVTNFVISNNRFDQDFAEGVFWGGGVNVVSQIGEALCRRGRITNNDFSGNYSYGGVVRLQSAWDMEVDNNTFHDLDLGTELPTPTQTMTAIRVVTRGISTAAQSGPSQNISIHHNTIHAPANNANLTNRQAIYIDNQFQTTRTPVKGIWVSDNHILSDSATVYWQNGIIMHGQSGGMEDVWIYNNHVEVYLQSGSIMGGGIGTIATDADGTVDRVYFGGNTVIEKGTPASSVHTGIAIGQFTDNVFCTAPNYLSNLFYGIRTLANSGPTIVGTDHQIFDGITSIAYLANVAPSTFADVVRVATDAQLNALTDAVNSLTGGYKYAGKMVWNSTQLRPVWAAGGNANSVWVFADGTTSNTPV